MEGNKIWFGLNLIVIVLRFIKKNMKKIILSLFLLGTLLSANAQLPGYVPSSGLVGWYPFNGNANDESGNGRDGTV